MMNKTFPVKENGNNKATLSKNSVIGLLVDGITNLERGLRIIDRGLIITKQTLDILAVDMLGQLTIIEMEYEENEAVILRALEHFDWIMHNINSVAHKYNKENIDITIAPRIMLISTRFSEDFTRKLTYVNTADIELYEYELNSEDGIKKLRFRPRVFSLSEHKTIEINKPRLEDLIDSIKVAQLKQLCRRVIKDCLDSLKDALIDTSTGYIEIRKQNKRLLGIYPQPTFFWVSFSSSGRWDGIKIEEGVKPEYVLGLVREKVK